MSDEHHSGVSSRGERYLAFQGRTARFAFPSTKVCRVLAREDVDEPSVFDLRAVLELHVDSESARVIELETSGQKQLFIVSAPLVVVQRGELRPLPSLVRARGAGRFLAAVLIDDSGPAVLVIDPDSLGRFTAEETSATKEEAS